MQQRGAQFVRTPKDHQYALQSAYTYSGGKNYKGLRADASAINWGLAVLELGGALTVIVMANLFLVELDKAKNPGQYFYHAANCCYFALCFAILTCILAVILILWNCADREWNSLGRSCPPLSFYVRQVSY